MLRVGTDCSGMEAPIQALIQLGIPFRHVFSSETDQDCIATIQENYHPDRIYVDMMNRSTKELPDIDLYVCGFPCQPFSNAGKREGWDDEKGRGHLFWHCLDVIRSKRPAVFILENVKGLVTLDDGSTFDTIQKELHKLRTYDITWKILNTKDYGIPHHRERLFIVGIHRDSGIHFEWPSEIKCPPLSSFVDHSNRSKEQIPPFVIESGVLERIPRDSMYIDIGYPKSNFSNSDKYSPCITTQGNLWCVPYQRRASIPELLRLQGFPKNMKQCVSDRQFKKQLGNTMSVNVLMAIFQSLYG